MNRKITVEFTGCSKKRDEFLDQITEPIDLLAGKRIQANGMIMFFREILKNIYDHADGMGKILFEETEVGIRFQIEDFGKGSHDLAVLKSKPSSKAGNGVNYGVGLYLIEGMAKDLKIVDFKIDCSKGFKYSGLYPYKTRA